MEEPSHIRRRVAIRTTSESTKDKAIMTMLQADAEDGVDLVACLIFVGICQVSERCQFWLLDGCSRDAS